MFLVSLDFKDNTNKIETYENITVNVSSLLYKLAESFLELDNLSKRIQKLVSGKSRLHSDTHCLDCFLLIDKLCHPGNALSEELQLFKSALIIPKSSYCYVRDHSSQRLNWLNRYKGTGRSPGGLGSLKTDALQGEADLCVCDVASCRKIPVCFNV